MIAGMVVPVPSRFIALGTDAGVMFGRFIDMAVKRPCRAIADSGENEPNHENAPGHSASLACIGDEREKHSNTSSVLFPFWVNVAGRTQHTI